MYICIRMYVTSQQRSVGGRAHLWRNSRMEKGTARDIQTEIYVCSYMCVFEFVGVLLLVCVFVLAAVYV